VTAKVAGAGIAMVCFAPLFSAPSLASTALPTVSTRGDRRFRFLLQKASHITEVPGGGSGQDRAIAMHNTLSKKRAARDCLEPKVAFA